MFNSVDEDGTERLSSEKLVHVLDKLGASPAQAAEVHALFESALRGGAAVDAETFFNVMSCTSLHATLQHQASHRSLIVPGRSGTGDGSA